MDNNASSPHRRPERARRAARPCDACRRRKSRCMTKGDSSVCTMCELRLSACTFLHQPAKRANKSDGRSHSGDDAPERRNAGATIGAASADAAVVSSNDGTVLVDHAPNAATEDRDGTEGRTAAAPLWSVQFDEGFDVRPGSSVAVPAPICESSEAEGRALGTEKSRFAELYGLTSDMEPILMRHRPYDASTHEYRLETHSIRRVQQFDNGMAYPVTYHMVSDHKSVGYSDDFSEVDAVESLVQPFGPRLVRLYWLLVQPAFPILYRKGFMKLYEASYRNIGAALLGAVYLKALAWWTYDPELSLRSLPDAGKLRRLTLGAIQNSFHRPRLSSIEGMLIYLHCRPEEPLTADHTYARGLTSQLLAISEAIGLHTDASQWAIPRWERAERKRIAWSVYMQDKWTALAYGRPSHITLDNWGVQDLTDDDFDLDEDGNDTAAKPATGQNYFCLMVDLTKILGQMLSEFFTIRTCQDQDTSKLFEKAQPLLQELAPWREKLYGTLPITSPRARQLCSVSSLHLCYHGVVVNLYRRLVRSLALAPFCSDAAVLSAVRQQATQSAHEATGFVSSLRLDQLESFWYFPSPYLFALLGSFQTLLLVTSVSLAERDYWREALRSYLWSLRTMSNASDPVRYAVNRLEGGVLRGLEHALAVNMGPMPSAATTATPIDLDQVLHELDLAQFSYSDMPDLGLQSFDWLAATQF